MKNLIGPHTRLREIDDLFLSRTKLHRKKPPFCLCARAKQAFRNISKMQLMERDAAGVLACNVVFL